MKKRILAALCAVMLLGNAVSAATFTDTAQMGSEVCEAIDVLSELGIMSGMGDGTFSPYTNLTRGQFAKIAVCIMGRTKEAVETTGAFSDVKSTDWYSGYVNLVAKEGIIAGYPDGRFGAGENLTFAQAVTVIVRLLNYDVTDVGYKWPQGYLEKAKVLEITEGINIAPGDPVTREQAAVMIYRALFTDMKGTKVKLITKMDKTVYEDAVVVATKNENPALLSDQVQTDKGIFTFDTNCDMTDNIGDEGTLVINDKSEIIAFVPDEDMTKTEYTISAIYKEGNSDNVSVVTEEGATVLIDGKTVLYMEGASYTASKLTEGINAGSKITLCFEDGKIKYTFAEEYKFEGPVTYMAGDNVKKLFGIDEGEGVTVIRKGIACALEDVQVYDVLYYSERTKTVYAYCDRVTGIYEDAYPIKRSAARVKVSGSEYDIASMTAVNKLNESAGAYMIGDRVTLLLDADGKVADVVTIAAADISTYGVLVGTGREISKETGKEGMTEFYVRVVLTNGEEVKYYVKDDDYDDSIGDFCVVHAEGGLSSLTFPKENKEGGRINKNTKTMGNTAFAKDYSILEYIDGNSAAAQVKKITIADIDSMRLEKKDIRHVQYNNDGEIEVLYINNVTGEGNVYGILVEVPEKTGSYVILSGKDKITVAGKYSAYKRGDCVVYKNGEMSFMTSLTSCSRIDSVTDNIIRVNGEAYTLDDDVEIYGGEYTWELKSMSMEEALNSYGTITLYSDRAKSDGGKVKVIKIIAKQTI